MGPHTLGRVRNSQQGREGEALHNSESFISLQKSHSPREGDEKEEEERSEGQARKCLNNKGIYRISV